MTRPPEDATAAPALPDLADHARAGCYPLAPLHLAALRDAAHRQRYHLAEIDCEGCTDKTQLLALTARQMRLPEYFGRNWDALYDCLTDPAALPIAPGHVLLFTRTQTLRQHAPEALATLREVCADAAEEARAQMPPRPLWTFLLAD
ncbi:MAG: barstar family protein [Rhodocyclaceae bacterium]|nr:barstar family protein [Rhodocyclaceae bacterium]